MGILIVFLVLALFFKVRKLIKWALILFLMPFCIHYIFAKHPGAVFVVNTMLSWGILGGIGYLVYKCIRKVGRHKSGVKS